MKVKISYTVDKNRIPEIIKSISEQVLEHANELKELAELMPTMGDYGISSLERIGRIREISESVQEHSREMEGILSGFLQGFVPRQEEVDQVDEEQVKAYEGVLEQLNTLNESLKERKGQEDVDDA